MYFQFAFHHSFIETLIKPQLGYHSFLPNFTAYLATLVPLKSAPKVTTLIALLFQIVPLILIINGKAIYWNTFLKKIIICILIITLAESELWLNSINTQFYLVLTTFLILIEPIDQYSGSRRTFLLALLSIALFTGPVACFLAPAFLLKAYLSKSKIDFQVAIFVICGAIIQGAICGYLLLYAPHGSRFVNFDIQIFVKSYLSDFLGLLKVVGINDKKNIGLIMLPYTLYLFYTMRKQKEGLLCIVSFILLTFLSLGSALNMTGSPRYGFVPSFILFTLIIHQLFVNTAVWEKYAAATIVILVFTLNIVYYQYEMNSSTEQCPNWKEEIAVWENDRKYQPIISPCGGTNEWRVKLSNED